MRESVQTLDFVELRNCWAFTLQVLLWVLDYKTEEYITPNYELEIVS